VLETDRSRLCEGQGSDYKTLPTLFHWGVLLVPVAYLAHSRSTPIRQGS